MSSKDTNHAGSPEHSAKNAGKPRNTDKLKADFDRLLDNINPFKHQDTASSEAKDRPRLFKTREAREDNFEQKWEEFSGNTQKTLESWQEERLAQREARIKQRFKNQKLRQNRLEHLQQQRQKERAQVQAFFGTQKEDFRQKLQELEGDRQTRAQERRNVRRLYTKESQLRNRAVAQSRQVTRQKLRGQRRTVRVKRSSALQARRNMKHGIRQEYVAETKELRQENWQNYVQHQKKQTQKFFKFQNRLWWRGYLSLLAWVFGIFILAIAIIYIFRLLGIDLIESITAGQLIFFPTE